MVRQNPRVQHVRVGEDDVGRLPNLPPMMRGRVAVVGGRVNAVGERRVRLGQLGDGPQLILREGFGGKQVEGLRLGIIEKRFRDRQVVAERLSARGRRDYHHVAPGADVLDGLDLVRVEPVDLESLEIRKQRSGQRPLEVGVTRLASRDDLRVDYLVAIVARPFKLTDKLAEIQVSRSVVTIDANTQQTDGRPREAGCQ